MAPRCGIVTSDSAESLQRRTTKITMAGGCDDSYFGKGITIGRKIVLCRLAKPRYLHKLEQFILTDEEVPSI